METLLAFIDDWRLNLGVARLWARDAAERAYMNTTLGLVVLALATMTVAALLTYGLVSALPTLPLGAELVLVFCVGLIVGTIAAFIIALYSDDVAQRHYRRRQAEYKAIWDAWHADLAHVSDRYESGPRD